MIMMVKKVETYETKDGKTFKTEAGALNHEKKLAREEKMRELNMTEEEIQNALEKTAIVNSKIKMLLKIKPWTKWGINLINLIDEDLLNAAQVKTTIYIHKIKESYYTNGSETELHVEKGPEFTDPELYVGDLYKVAEVVQVNELTQKVVYDYKLSYEERLALKVKNGEDLNERELRDLNNYFEVVYEEEGEPRRWSKYMTTVIKVDDELYCYTWDKGLTENQENEFYDQPYPVNLETEVKMIEVETTKIIPIEK